LKTRSDEKELLDLGPAYYSAEEYAHCMKRLFLINRLLGFFKSTVKLLKKFPQDASLLDVGCGDGLFLLHLSQYFPQMQFQGNEISAAGIQLAREAKKQFLPASQNVTFELLTTPELKLPPQSVDIILTTLVCHHLSNQEIIAFIRAALNSARRAVIINDLHRHKLAYWSYRLLSPIFRNRLITHDGLISIKRGFVRREWEAILQAAGVQHYKLTWCFPFRWQLTLTRDRHNLLAFTT
jgi:2-polyprenyl-3-methyl-5-hydroxy-6-metoxy-1,4-benzoquinol methylase